MEAASSTKARIVFFEFWTDPVAQRILDGQPGIEVTRLLYGDPEADSNRRMAAAHGYQIQTRGELTGHDAWFCHDDLVRRAPNLLAVCSTGSGYDIVDVDACTRAGIVVCNQAGANKEAVAEHALGFIIALSKRMMESDKALRRGTIDRYAIDGHDILGKTVGIVGIGNIGTRVAQLCSGLFGMKVLACDPYLDAATIGARHAAKATLDEVLAQADFVTVHCPRNAETLGMFGADQFRRMKPTAYFISTARGGIHDEAALDAALGAGTIAGAGLDVWMKEPPPSNHPLLARDNVIATPHSAGMTRESLYNMSEHAARQWIDIFAAKVPPRLLNPQAWPRYRERFAAQFGRLPPPLP
jgi:D-3-phosphoglycerate dehydrogenase / 2-oxoglutarate reductase